jgi:uncharacterized protein (TIGR00299 family) protein
MYNKTLYIECYSGISGDMMVGALLDLGADEELLKKALDSLNVDGYEIEIGRTQKCGIDACDFNVILDQDEHHVHDHHHYDHAHYHNHHHHEHRNIYDIYKIIDESQISDRAKNISKKIFNIVAKAESKAHGIDIGKVHFHEVGAIDSIVDIVAVAVCIDNLDIEEVIVSELYEGKGHVKCQHGIIPVPVPAVTNIVVDNSLSIRITDTLGEMITPTGAAIAAALKTKDSLPENHKIRKVGMGAGKKDFERANILRAFIIEEIYPNSNNDEIWLLETNLDDCTGENLGYTIEKLVENGAKDVFYTPIYMKKNRPAYKLSVLCQEENIKSMEAIIFKNTTSIGIRRYKTNRTILKRKVKNIETKYGQVRVKICCFENDKYYYPEYEDIKNICNKTGLGFKTVYDAIKTKLC